MVARESLIQALLLVPILCGCQADGQGSEETSSEAASSATDAESSGATDEDSSTGTQGEASEGSGSEDAGTDETEAPGQQGIVYVAVADGGWLASSCDGGRSWTHTAFSDEIGDHTPWTAFGGLTYGEGAFVAGFGWGSPGSLVRSDDGVDWEQLSDSSFSNLEQEPGYDSWTSAVVHTGTRFVAYANWRWHSDDAGQTWQASELSLPPGADQARQMRAFPDAGLMVAALESQAGEGHPVGNFVVVSEDEGETWQEGQGFDGNCAAGVQHYGDIEARGDTILIAADGLCRSDDRGQNWDSLSTPEGLEVQDLFVDDQGFGLVTGSRVYRSADDGLSWTQIADVGGPLRAVTWSTDGYVGVSLRGDAFYWSEDGSSWTAAETDWAPAGEVWVRDLAVGELNETACEGT